MELKDFEAKGENKTLIFGAGCWILAHYYWAQSMRVRGRDRAFSPFSPDLECQWSLSTSNAVSAAPHVYTRLHHTPTLTYYLQPQRGWAAGKIQYWNAVAVWSILDRYLLEELLLCGRLIKQSQSITSRALFLVI